MSNGRVETPCDPAPLSRLILEGDLDPVHGQGGPAGGGASVVVGVQLFEGRLKESTAVTLNLQVYKEGRKCFI